MLLKITEKCSMNCTHCMNNATENGNHMSQEVLNDSLKFIFKNNLQYYIIITGGEPTEHPEFYKFAKQIINFSKNFPCYTMVTITTNGFWILENIEKAKKLVEMSDECTKVVFQISTDSRYYPKKIDKTKRIWRENGFILCDNCVDCIYPQGRAKDNKYQSDYISTKCFNIRAIAKQLDSPSLNKIVETLALNKKFCTPAIKINGDVILGESDLCPKCFTIYDSNEEIVNKIKEFKCNGCYPLNENLPEIYKRFVN